MKQLRHRDAWRRQRGIHPEVGGGTRSPVADPGVPVQRPWPDTRRRLQPGVAARMRSGRADTAHSLPTRPPHRAAHPRPDRLPPDSCNGLAVEGWRSPPARRAGVTARAGRPGPADDPGAGRPSRAPATCAARTPDGSPRRTVGQARRRRGPAPSRWRRGWRPRPECCRRCVLGGRRRAVPPSPVR